MLPHIHENTLNVALAKVKPLMPDVEPFCIHDFRRTARTHLAALGVDAQIAERCLNHKIRGIEGIYNRHDYFDERRKALTLWAEFLEGCEVEGEQKMTFTSQHDASLQVENDLISDCEPKSLVSSL